MIQIKETDFLWKCYKYFYNGQPPHPRSVCNYFWKSIGGMLCYVFKETSVWIGLPILAGLFCLLLPNFIKMLPAKEASALEILGVAGFIIICVYTFFYAGRKFVKFCDSHGQAGQIIKITNAAIVITFIMSLWFSAIWASPDHPYNLWYLLYGFLMTLGFYAALAIIAAMFWFFNSKSPTRNVIVAYIKSFKDRVCPLVKIPEEEKPQ